MRRTPRDTEATAKSVTRRALFMGGCMAAMVAAVMAGLLEAFRVVVLVATW